jgi:hypothetical protein
VGGWVAGVRWGDQIVSRNNGTATYCKWLSKRRWFRVGKRVLDPCLGTRWLLGCVLVEQHLVTAQQPLLLRHRALVPLPIHGLVQCIIVLVINLDLVGPTTLRCVPASAAATGYIWQRTARRTTLDAFAVASLFATLARGWFRGSRRRRGAVDGWPRFTLFVVAVAVVCGTFGRLVVNDVSLKRRSIVIVGGFAS